MRKLARPPSLPGTPHGSRSLAELQRELEDDARKLGVSVDQALGENGRGRLNTEGIRQAIEPIERGDIEGGRERLEAGRARAAPGWPATSRTCKTIPRRWPIGSSAVRTCSTATSTGRSNRMRSRQLTRRGKGRRWPRG